MTRADLEALAAKRGVRLDGVSDAVARLRVVSVALGGLTVEQQSPGYVSTALDELARLDGLTPREARFDDPTRDPRKSVDRASELDQLRERAAKAREAVKRDTEGAWARPPSIGAHTGEDPARGALQYLAAGGLSRLGETTAARPTGAREAVSAEQARQARLSAFENAWRGVPANASTTTMAAEVARLREL